MRVQSIVSGAEMADRAKAALQSPGQMASGQPDYSTESPLDGIGAQSDQRNIQVSDEVIRAAAEAANKISHVFNTKLEFEVHEDTKIEMIKVVDTRSNIVIREIPPHEILDMIAKLWETIGIFVDRKA